MGRLDFPLILVKVNFVDSTNDKKKCDFKKLNVLFVAAINVLSRKKGYFLCKKENNTSCSDGVDFFFHAISAFSTTAFVTTTSKYYRCHHYIPPSPTVN